MTKPASYRLYHFPGSRSARVKWALHETVGDAFETVRVDLYRGEQYHAEYVAKNPNHNVPLLEISFAEGSPIRMVESAAMVAFLADAYPEKNLTPPTDDVRARADYAQAMQFGASTMDMMLWQVRIHEHILSPDDRDERTVKRYRSKFRREVEPQLAARLGDKPFICGDQFTAADCIIGQNVGWARAYGMCRDDVFAEYLIRLSARPAYQKAFADLSQMQIAPPPLPPGMKSPFNG